MSEPTVWVIQESLRHDLTAARKFGSLEVLCPPGDVSVSAAPIVRKIRQKLVNFSDADFLLLTGDPVLIGIATAIACEYNGGRCRVLKWSRSEADYFPLQFSIRHTGPSAKS